MAVETVGLANTATHLDAVNSMAQPFFGNRNEELRALDSAAVVQAESGAERKYKCRMIPLDRSVKETGHGNLAAQFLSFIKPE